MANQRPYASYLPENFDFVAKSNGGPGGYMLTGVTNPGVDVLGPKEEYSPNRRWLCEDMDVIEFYEVTEDV